MKTAVTRFAAAAVSAFWLIMVLVGPMASVALAGTLHPAELVGLKSVVGAPTQIVFVNVSTQTIRIYWLNYEGRRVLYQTLNPGEKYGVDTYLHHPWLITDEDDNAWNIYFAEAQPSRIAITKPEAD